MSKSLDNDTDLRIHHIFKLFDKKYITDNHEEYILKLINDCQKTK